jgi:hypothetical protein
LVIAWADFGHLGKICPKFLESFLAQFSLTSFNRARFQIVAKFPPENEFFLLAPLFMLQVRSQTNAFSNK